MFQNEADIFIGNLIIDGYDVTSKNEFRIFILPKSEYNESWLGYFDYSDPNDQFYVHTFGYITSKPFLKEFSIYVAEPIDNNGNQWSSDKGLIIAAPASDRQEAVAMEKSLKDPYLKN